MTYFAYTRRHASSSSLYRTALKTHHSDQVKYSIGDTIEALTYRVERMNRRKKIKQLLAAHAKKARAKLAPPNKSTYISKADRLKLATEPEQESITPPVNASKSRRANGEAN